MVVWRCNLDAEQQAALCFARHVLVMPHEVNGRKGPEPTRYGDWENKGIASDF
ncbi:MAG: DUF1674 domain-containing protein [Aestuariivirga sp.]